MSLGAGTAGRLGLLDASECPALIDGLGKITGRAQIIWFLVFGGLFLVAYSNAALGSPTSALFSGAGRR